MSSLCFIYIYIQLSSSIFLNLSTRKVRNVCVTNDHGYVPFVVITIWSFPHSCLITGFARRATRRVQHVEQKLPTLLESLASSPFFTCLNVIHAIKLHVFTFLVPCYDLIYDFPVKTMFDSSRLILVSSTQFPYQIMHMSFNSNIKCVTCGTGIVFDGEFVLLDF